MTLKTAVCIDGKINIFCNSNIMLNAGLDFSPTDKCRKFEKPTIKLQFEYVCSMSLRDEAVAYSKLQRYRILLNYFLNSSYAFLCTDLLSEAVYVPRNTPRLPL